MLLAATEGAFDTVPVKSIHKALEALLDELNRKHKKDMEKLNEGDKPSDKLKKTVLDVAKNVAKDYKESK
jgi:F0F1-type ATP synthase alpha subunit